MIAASPDRLNQKISPVFIVVNKPIAHFTDSDRKGLSARPLRNFVHQFLGECKDEDRAVTFALAHDSVQGLAPGFAISRLPLRPKLDIGDDVSYLLLGAFLVNGNVGFGTGLGLAFLPHQVLVFRNWIVLGCFQRSLQFSIRLPKLFEDRFGSPADAAHDGGVYTVDPGACLKHFSGWGRVQNQPFEILDLRVAGKELADVRAQKVIELTDSVRVRNFHVIRKLRNLAHVLIRKPRSIIFHLFTYVPYQVKVRFDLMLETVERIL